MKSRIESDIIDFCLSGAAIHVDAFLYLFEIQVQPFFYIHKIAGLRILRAVDKSIRCFCLNKSKFSVLFHNSSKFSGGDTRTYFKYRLFKVCLAIFQHYAIKG